MRITTALPEEELLSPVEEEDKGSQVRRTERVAFCRVDGDEWMG